MPVRTAHAVWHGDLKGGDGTVALGSGLFEGPYDFRSRFEEGPNTNPDELLGAAHAACFSMALANMLAGEGSPPTEVRTEAHVHLGKDDEGAAITKIVLVCHAKVPGMSAEAFAEVAERAKVGCPVSKALKALPIELDATLD